MRNHRPMLNNPDFERKAEEHFKQWKEEHNGDEDAHHIYMDAFYAGTDLGLHFADVLMEQVMPLIPPGKLEEATWSLLEEMVGSRETSKVN